MPASLFLEEAILSLVLKKETITGATKTYLGLSSYTAGELEKKIKGKEFGEHEPANGWARVEISTAAKPGWTVTKAENTGFTKYENTNAIKTGTEAFEFKATSAGSVICKTFAILDALTEGNILAFGTLEVETTVTSATKLEVAAKALKFECE